MEKLISPLLAQAVRIFSLTVITALTVACTSSFEEASPPSEEGIPIASDSPEEEPVDLGDCLVLIYQRAEGCDAILSVLQEERTEFARDAKSNQIKLSLEVTDQHFHGMGGAKYSAKRIDLGELAYNYYLMDEKPTQYVGVSSEFLWIVTGDGAIGKLDRSDESLSNWETVPSNLDAFMEPELAHPGWFSVKGLLVHGNQFFVSLSRHSDSESSDCWTTGIVRADISEFLKFEEFFLPKSCAAPSAPEFNGHQAGGAITRTSSGGILFGLGDYRQRSRAQDFSDPFGSLLLIDNEGSERFIAGGLRNPQSVMVSSDGLIFITDQGPRGGDELNAISITEMASSVNFGWPTSSYGEHYDLQFRAEAPLKKSHLEEGFREPLWHWNPSVAPSSISTLPQDWAGDIVVGSMGHQSSLQNTQSLLVFEAIGDGDPRVALIDQIKIGERVRSLAVMDEHLVVSVESGALLLISRTT